MHMAAACPAETKFVREAFKKSNGVSQKPGSISRATLGDRRCSNMAPVPLHGSISMVSSGTNRVANCAVCSAKEGGVRY